jgi:hypothetical protein
MAVRFTQMELLFPGKPEANPFSLLVAGGRSTSRLAWSHPRMRGELPRSAE